MDAGPIARWGLLVFVLALLVYQLSGAGGTRPMPTLTGAPPMIQGELLDAPLRLPDGHDALSPGEAARSMAEQLRQAGKLGQKVMINGELVDASSVTPEQLASAQLPAAAVEDNGYKHVTFDFLADYDYEMADPLAAAKARAAGESDADTQRIPRVVRELDGSDVAVQGFMVPIKLEQGGVKTFLLVRNQMMCCFGIMPKLNEWIYVKMKNDKPGKFVPDFPVTVSGRLSVGEEIKNGRVVSLYRMEADAIRWYGM